MLTLQAFVENNVKVLAKHEAKVMQYFNATPERRARFAVLDVTAMRVKDIQHRFRWLVRPIAESAGAQNLSPAKGGRFRTSACYTNLTTLCAGQSPFAHLLLTRTRHRPTPTRKRATHGSLLQGACAGSSVALDAVAASAMRNAASNRKSLRIMHGHKKQQHSYTFPAQQAQLRHLRTRVTWVCLHSLHCQGQSNATEAAQSEPLVKEHAVHHFLKDSIRASVGTALRSFGCKDVRESITTVPHAPPCKQTPSRKLASC